MSEPPPGDGAAAEDGGTLVEVVIDDPRWEEAGLEALADRAARALLAELGIAAEECEISLLGTDDARIASLNASFRGRDAPTNVLSWPAVEFDLPGHLPAEEERPVFLGDVALAFGTCTEEARTANIPFRDHVLHLCVHGILHLLGYDHETDADAGRMESLEVKALASLGIPDPYCR